MRANFNDRISFGSVRRRLPVHFPASASAPRHISCPDTDGTPPNFNRTIYDFRGVQPFAFFPSRSFALDSAERIDIRRLFDSELKIM